MNNGWKGRKHSEETKEKLRRQHLGLKASAETKLKMSLARKGKPKSAEWRRKISESNKAFGNRPWARKSSPARFGEANSFYGRHHTEKTKQRLREARLEQNIPRISKMERKLLKEFIQKGYEPLTQVPLEKICIVDFFFPPNVVVFCDGDYWHNLPEYKRRDATQNHILRSRGYRVIRIWESEARDDMENCLGRVIKCLQQRNN